MRFSTGLALMMCACGLHASTAASPTYSIDAHVQTAGSSAILKSPCFRLRATIAEPVVGFSSSASYTLSAGFRAGVPNAGDDVFFSAFEACP